jgi:integrase
VRRGKGDKDRSLPITDTLLHRLRRWWATHRHPRLIFPDPCGGPEQMHQATTPMDRGGVQAAMSAAVADARIRLRIGVHSLRHCFVSVRRTTSSAAPASSGKIAPG